MASRRKARILAFQALYAWDANNDSLDSILSFSWLDDEKKGSLDLEMATFSRLLIKGTLENIEEIDKTIRENISHWSFDRLKKVDLAVLRISVYSLLYQRDMPARITIDEAIEIAKEYGSNESFKFVNGVLDSVWKKTRPEGELSEGVEREEGAKEDGDDTP